MKSEIRKQLLKLIRNREKLIAIKPNVNKKRHNINITNTEIKILDTFSQYLVLFYITIEHSKLDMILHDELIMIITEINFNVNTKIYYKNKYQ